MWHEARKQEKKIREAVVDFQKRAERRRQHYAKQRKDPMQLMRVYGRKTPLHLNPAASKMSSSMIPWQGDESNMISRYDVRVNLDYIPDYSKLPKPIKSVTEEWEEQRCNYERYRFLVLNQFKRVSEQEALASIDVDEMFHVPGQPSGSSGFGGGFREKAKSQARAAIGYTYGGGDESTQAKRDEQLLAEYLGEDEEEEAEDKTFSSESEYEVDMDLDNYSSTDVDKLNVLALEYGIAASSFSKNLRTEKKSMEEAKLARISDMEKAAMPGRRSRRDRRQMRERAPRRISTPPTYAQRGSPTYEPYKPPEQRSRSSSRSSSPGEGKVEFITEFGGDEEEGGASQPLGHTHTSGGREVVPKSGRAERNRTRTSSRWSRHRSRSHSPVRCRNSRSPRRRNSRSHSPRRRDSHSPRHRDSRSPRRRDSHSPRRRDSHSPRHRDSHSPRRRDSHSPRHRDSHSPRHRDSHSPRHRDSHSPRRRDSHSSRHRASRSRSRSGERSHSKRSCHRSSSRERKRHRGPSESREQGPTHQSTSASSSTSTTSSETTPTTTTPIKTTPTDKTKLPLIQKPTISTKPTKEKAKLTPQERLKKKMQAQLSRQFKQDKKTQKERESRKQSERIEREEEMRDQMRRIRERGRSAWDHSPSPPYGYTSAHYDH